MSRTLKRRELTALEAAGFDARRIGRARKRERNLSFAREQRKREEARREQREA